MITRVYISDKTKKGEAINLFEVYVLYANGNHKYYHFDRVPKTVQAFINRAGVADVITYHEDKKRYTVYAKMGC